jgi:hypothetical protein
VISFPEGAAPEIGIDGVNGFLCSDAASMARAVDDLGVIDRRVCRASVEERFSVERTVRDHVHVYRGVIEAWGGYEDSALGQEAAEAGHSGVADMGGQGANHPEVIVRL